MSEFKSSSFMRKSGPLGCLALALSLTTACAEKMAPPRTTGPVINQNMLQPTGGALSPGSVGGFMSFECTTFKGNLESALNTDLGTANRLYQQDRDVNEKIMSSILRELDNEDLTRRTIRKLGKKLSKAAATPDGISRTLSEGVVREELKAAQGVLKKVIALGLSAQEGGKLPAVCTDISPVIAPTVPAPSTQDGEDADDADENEDEDDAAASAKVRVIPPSVAVAKSKLSLGQSLGILGVTDFDLECSSEKVGTRFFRFSVWSLAAKGPTLSMSSVSLSESVVSRVVGKRFGIEVPSSVWYRFKKLASKRKIRNSDNGQGLPSYLMRSQENSSSLYTWTTTEDASFKTTLYKALAPQGCR